MSRSRAYCFTINNYTDDDILSSKQLEVDSKYVIVGQEKGEQGTVHLQGYVYFKEAKSFSSVKKRLPRAHLEVSKGTPEDNKRYCSKEHVLFEFGDCPQQGARTDIERVVNDLREGANMRSIADKARSMQSVKMAEVWLKYHEEPRTWKPYVKWYYGSTGSGKTKTAREWLGDDIYTSLDSIKWWEGYDKHENVLIDDFRKDFCKFYQLLKLLDRYEYKVETKGGSRQFLAKNIAITSPYPPQLIYDNREDVQQLLRRIDEVVQIGDKVDQINEPDYIN